MTSEECYFYAEGFCAPPEEFGFTCQWAKPKSGLMYCCANASFLFTEKDFEAQQIKNLFSGKDWEEQKIKKLFTRTVEIAFKYQRALNTLQRECFFEEGGE